MSEIPTERIRRELSKGQSTYRLAAVEVTIEDLINAKRRGIRVQKMPPYGLTLEQYGHIYSIGGYKVTVKGSVEEIERKLKEVK